MSDRVKNLASIFGLIGIIISGFLFLESRTTTIATDVVTPALEAVAALDRRLTLAELRELHRKALNDYYHWKDLHERYPRDKEIKDSLDQAKKRVEELEERIKELEKKS